MPREVVVFMREGGGRRREKGRIWSFPCLPCVPGAQLSWANVSAKSQSWRFYCASAHEGDDGVVGAEFAAVGQGENGRELVGARGERCGERDLGVARGHGLGAERPAVEAQGKERLLPRSALADDIPSPVTQPCVNVGQTSSRIVMLAWGRMTLVWPPNSSHTLDV